jgi:hypothetical protein
MLSQTELEERINEVDEYMILGKRLLPLLEDGRAVALTNNLINKLGEISRTYNNALKCGAYLKSDKRASAERLRELHEAEVNEAEFSKTLSRIGFDDKEIFEAVDKPEFIFCRALVVIKNQYAPWL